MEKPKSVRDSEEMITALEKATVGLDLSPYADERQAYEYQEKLAHRQIEKMEAIQQQYQQHQQQKQQFPLGRVGTLLGGAPSPMPYQEGPGPFQPKPKKPKEMSVDDVVKDEINKLKKQF